MSFFPDTASAISISALTDAGAVALSDKLLLDRANSDYTTTGSALGTLVRETPAPSRMAALPAVLNSTDNDKNVVLTGSGGALSVDGTVADGFRCFVLNTASGAATLSRITGVGGSSIPAGSFAWVAMASGAVYAGIPGGSGVSAATAYTLVQDASSGTVGTVYHLTLAPTGGNWPASETVTLNMSGTGTATLANGTGGTLLGSVLTVPAGTTTNCTVTVTTTGAGTIIVTPTNSGTLTNPAAVTYTASARGAYPSTPSGMTLLARFNPSVASTVTTGATGYPAGCASQITDSNGGTGTLVPAGGVPADTTWYPRLLANTPAGLSAVGIQTGSPPTGMQSTGAYLNALQHGFTIGGSFLISSVPSGYTPLLQLCPSGGDGPGTANYDLNLNGTSWYWARWNGSANDAYVTGSLAPSGHWNNFVLTFDGTAGLITCWINGAKTSTTIIGTAFVPAILYVGFNNGGSVPYFDFGEIELYSGAPTDAFSTSLSTYLDGQRS